MENSAKAYSIICPDNKGPFFFTAEHASNRIPVKISKSDGQFLNTHWAYDIGIAPLIQQLCQKLSCSGVQTEYSRLWIDANRAPNQDGLIKTSIEGKHLSFNQRITPAEKDFRIQSFHEKYHNTISEELRKHNRSPILISLHSFTPIWNNQIRTMDIGVLFDRDEDLAYAVAKRIEDEGFFVAMNKPYSGKNGLIYAADRHGNQENIPYVEFEFNQSILCTPKRISFVADRMAMVLKKLNQEYLQFL